MWVLKRKEDGLYVTKTEFREVTGNSYTKSILNAKKYSTEAEAIADSCVENEVPVQIDPYDYFK